MYCELIGGGDEVKEGVVDDNDDELACLKEIELARVTMERADVGKMNLAESNRIFRLREGV